MHGLHSQCTACALNARLAIYASDIVPHLFSRSPCIALHFPLHLSAGATAGRNHGDHTYGGDWQLMRYTTSFLEPHLTLRYHVYLFSLFVTQVSMGVSPILGNNSVMHSEFDPDPEAVYAQNEARILHHLNLPELGGASEGGAAAGGGWT
jgi:hypothetical protein